MPVQSDDLSLRDSASDCLKGIITRLARESDADAARQRALFHTVVLQNLLPEVKRNVKLKSEVCLAKHELTATRYSSRINSLWRFLKSPPIFFMFATNINYTTLHIEP